MKKKNQISPKELPRKMYGFFTSYADTGAPSYEKFARSIGITLEELERYRKYKIFDRAYRECGEIRRDYLIDCALTKRHDPSFVKFLLICEFGMGEDKPERGENDFHLTLEVV